MLVYEYKNGYTGSIDIDTLLISKDTLVNGERYFYSTFASEYNLYGVYLTNRSDGVYGLTESGPVRVFKYPVIKGEKFLSPSGRNITVQSIDQLISTPAGNFTTIHY